MHACVIITVSSVTVAAPLSRFHEERSAKCRPAEETFSIYPVISRALTMATMRDNENGIPYVLTGVQRSRCHGEPGESGVLKEKGLLCDYGVSLIIWRTYRAITVELFADY